MADTPSVEDKPALPVVQPIEDQLGDGPDPEGFAVEPLETPSAQRSADGDVLARSIRFFGLAVTLFVAVLTVETLLQNRRSAPTPSSPSASPAGPRTPLDLEPVSVVDDSLDAAVEAISRGLFRDAVRLLEPFEDSISTDDPDRAMELHTYLARAYAALGDLENSHRHRLRAATASISRKTLRQALEEVEQYVDRHLYPEARRACYRILAQEGDLSERERSAIVQVSMHLAQSLVHEAQRSGEFEAVPGTRPFVSRGGRLR